jgi:antitoxin component YwqK of YwqJK toxin-antitoxin module
MKKLYPLLSVLFFISFGFSQKEYHYNELIEMDNGLWTVKFSDEPISGKIYSGFGEDGNLKKGYIGNIVNGKKEGKWVFYYHSTGKKIYEDNYKDGKQDGFSFSWYENGQKQVEKPFKDGKLDGLWTYWDDNGNKREVVTYKDGKKDGLFTNWYENGQKKLEGTYKDGEIVKVIGLWNEDGSVKE